MNRQSYVATAIHWAATAAGEKYAGAGAVEKYMEDHRYEKNAEALLAHFRAVIDWTRQTFPTYREEMKGVDWGWLFYEYGEKVGAANAAKLEAKIKTEMDDPDTKGGGVYAYVLTGERKYLHIRAFNSRLKRVVYERQNGRCPGLGAGRECPSGNKKFAFAEMHGDHIRPWSTGGKTNLGNCQMLCAKCNGEKGAG